jgi:hypothetical protein
MVETSITKTNENVAPRDNDCRRELIVTFGQSSPFRNGYVVCSTNLTDMVDIHIELTRILGKWSNVRERHEVEFRHFPAGCLGKMEA